MLHRENEIKKYSKASAANLLKEVMEYYDITQEDLASRIGVSQKNISDILNRKRFMNERVALRIEKVMGISSKLLLSLDLNYKLQLAKEEEENSENKRSSDQFLKRYDWVHA